GAGLADRGAARADVRAGAEDRRADLAGARAGGLGEALARLACHRRCHAPVGYPSASEALIEVTAWSSQRPRVARSVHASMRASSSRLGASCRRARTRFRAAP